MKKYENVELELIKIADVIATSNIEDDMTEPDRG